MNRTYDVLEYCIEQTMIHSPPTHLLKRLIHINMSLEESTIFLSVTKTRLQDPTEGLFRVS